MKKVIVIIVLIFGFLSHAQTKDELLSIMANETCECINKEGDNLSKEEIQMKLGVCMLKSYNKRKDKFIAAGVKFDSYESGRKLGEQVGYKMAEICPEVFMSFVDDATTQSTTKTESVTSINGNIESITGDDFSFVNLKDENGKTHQFLWLRNFEGSAELMENPKLKTKVIIHYESIECYVPKMNDYYSFNEITKIEYL